MSAAVGHVGALNLGRLSTNNHYQNKQQNKYDRRGDQPDRLKRMILRRFMNHWVQVTATRKPPRRRLARWTDLGATVVTAAPSL
jgi:hypothetical protein